MEKAKLAILEGELRRQESQIDKIYLKIEDRARYMAGAAGIESVAYHMHNLYCAYEDLFKIITDAFENNIEEGLAYHKELLRRMSVTIKGLRPNLVGEESLELLSELRAFRHFFRHAYAYELDPEKVKLVLEKALKLNKIFRKDLSGFIDVLRKR